MTGQASNVGHRQRALQAALIYSAFGAAWILFSDIALNVWIPDPAFHSVADILKGWLFVSISALLLYGLISRSGQDNPVDFSDDGSIPGDFSRWPRWAKYGAALIVTVLMLVIRNLIAETFPEPHRPLLMVLMFPIILSATVGGIGPGILSTVICALTVSYVAIEPVGSFAIAAKHDLIYWSFLLIDGALVSIMAELLRVSWRRTSLELAARARENHLLQRIADASDDAIFAKDLDGRYILFNRAAGQFVGKSPRAVLGHDDRSLFPPEQAELLMKLGRNVISSSQSQTAEEILDTPTGTRVFHATKGPLIDSRGQVYGTFGISRDITADRKAELALEQSEARYRSLFTHSPDAIFVYQADALTLVNRACLNLFKADEEAQLLGKSPFALFHPDSHELLRQRLRRMIESGLTESLVEERIVCLDGSTAHVEAVATTFPLGDETAIHVILHDISRRKQNEKELRAQALELAERNEWLERFNRVAVGRELAMIELKQQINDLSRQLGRPPPYPLDLLRLSEQA